MSVFSGVCSGLFLFYLVYIIVFIVFFNLSISLCECDSCHGCSIFCLYDGYRVFLMSQVWI